MKKINNLPRDLAEEVLSKTPLTSVRKVRSTCKKWNTLSKNSFFAKKHIGQAAKVAEAKDEFTMVMIIDFRVYLTRIKFSSNVESCIIKHEAKLDSDLIDEVRQVFHCDGSLLCISKDDNKLVVFNPYWGQTRWVESTHIDIGSLLEVFKIYDFSSDSWRVLDVTPDWNVQLYRRGVTLKGNTYWFASERILKDTAELEYSFLVCFDFTRERFGPRLPLPVTLSIVRGEQLAVLFEPWGHFKVEIWVMSPTQCRSKAKCSYE
ncbi:unnamed protein product [Microthlaspi erraticum]|uniref:F-box domain-containing protein n=1 Tax=Microthlaspi erraticum TaxID=1685480 RepID=A0A6D2K446_9BRAS|nr:unnamed protein product [Microthlaspi erraticum]